MQLNDWIFTVLEKKKFDLIFLKLLCEVSAFKTGFQPKQAHFLL